MRRSRGLSICQKYLLIPFVISLSLLFACKHETVEPAQEMERQVYAKTTRQIPLQDEFEPYLASFSGEGVCYVVREVSGDDQNYKTEYKLFYQAYEEDKGEQPIALLEDGIVKDIAVYTSHGETKVAVLWLQEEAHLLEYDSHGKQMRDVVLNHLFQAAERVTKLALLPTGEAALYSKDAIYQIGLDGSVKASVPVQGYVQALLCTEEGKLYALYEGSAQSGSNGMRIREVDFATQKLSEPITTLESIGGASVYDEKHLAILSENAIYLIDGSGAEATVIVDLNQQSLLYSEIKAVTKQGENIQIISLDSTTNTQLYQFLLSQKDAGVEEAATPETTDKIIEYTEDGRPVIHVAVPETYRWQIEYYCKKYNQISGDCFVKIDRFQGSLEEYLGKGNRPDVIMLEDHTELEAYVQKQLLVDLNPIFAQQETYSLEGFIPRIIELLSMDQGLYGISGRFRLLLQSSTGEELGADGTCTPMQYFAWYDTYLQQKGIQGMGNLEAILYANLPSFYDEETGGVSFTGEPFMELMKAYKGVLERGKQEKTKDLVATYGYTVKDIFEGPKWYFSLANATCFGDTNNLMQGVPGMDGGTAEMLSIPYPMAIMQYSNWPESAFDFILYYCSQSEYIVNGNSTADVGKSYTTYAPFSTLQETLRSEIYETEKPFAVVRNDDGTMQELYFTEKMLQQLEDLIQNASLERRAQKEIFVMLQEEMAAYFEGTKTLEDACRILQSRAEIYLQERL